MKLAQLCQDIIEIHPEHRDVEITSLALDSRKVSEGCLFFAIPGLHQDGIDYIPQAIENGANAILCEESIDLFNQADIITDSGKQVPIYAVPHLSLHIGSLASKYFGYPSHQFNLIGVTGTNGKSSTVYFIAQALSLLHEKCAMLGTIGNGFINQLKQSQYTTADAIALQTTFAEYVSEKVTTVAMEVSSHGLAQGRVNGCAFDIAAFTNLTHDHLDYHGDMHHYGLAKRKLFLLPGLRYAIFNIDDAFGEQLYQEFRDKLTCYAISMQTPSAKIPNESLLQIVRIEQQPTGITFSVVTPWGNATISTSLFGKFNLVNLLITMSCLALMQTPWVTILAIMPQLSGVPGRMQLLQKKGQPKVIIDYAHTPDALEKALIALADHQFGRIWCVFGCGGDRDKTKRPLMGQIAQRYANQVIITSDNPRSEAPELIIQDILQGMASQSGTIIQADRREAIELALQQADENDVILVAGKGHETYQEMAGIRYPFSDKSVVEQFWAKQELCK